MRSGAIALIALLAGGAGVVSAVAVAGAQSSAGGGSGTAGPGTIVTPAPGVPAPSGPPVGSAQQQTHPVVRPRHGMRRSHFRLQFVLSDAPGHQGVTESEYRIAVDQPPRSRAACLAVSPADITSGAQGASVTVALRAPRYGWCRGVYTATVFLQRGPYCPPPQDGQPPQPCPEFATQDLQVGISRFTIRPRTTRK